MTYKLLGFYISEDLSWNSHIEHIVKKANKRLYALHTLKKKWPYYHAASASVL